MQSSPQDPDFSGIWIPLITPFANGAIDHTALSRLVKRCAADGVAGFVACGSTGEAAALDEAEQLAVLDTVLSATSLPVLMGLAGHHAGELQARLQRFASRPIAGLLVPPPHYVRPSQKGIVEHFVALADASPVPLVLYDIPYRTGVSIELESFRALAQHPHIRAVKDCGGSSVKTEALIADGRLQLLAGEDAQIFGTLCLGGRGAITAAAHVHTELFVAMARAVQHDRLTEARRLHHALSSLIRLLFAEPNPGPLKALLAHHGEVHNELRAPMTQAAPELVERLLAVHDAVPAQAAAWRRPLSRR